MRVSMALGMLVMGIPFSSALFLASPSSHRLQATKKMLPARSMAAFRLQTVADRSRFEPPPGSSGQWWQLLRYCWQPRA